MYRRGIEFSGDSENLIGSTSDSQYSATLSEIAFRPSWSNFQATHPQSA
jgi:hypothetical protein